jgi:tetratricopeptide (TPR) repeat protein
MVTSVRVRRPAGRALMVALVVALPATALAQPKPASRELREAEARRACAAGQVEKGIDLLAELLVELGHPNYVYNQARCYQQNGRAEEAINRFREYLRSAPNISTSERQRVEGFVTELEAELARRRAQANTTQPADAQAQTPPPRTEPSTRVPPPPEQERPAGKVTETTAAAGERAQTLRRSAFILGGVGLLGLGVGAFSSFKVHSIAEEQKDLLAAAHDKGGTVEFSVYQENEDAGKRYEKLQWLGYGVGAAALVGAGICLLLASGDETSSPSAVLVPELGPGRAGGVLRVSF